MVPIAFLDETVRLEMNTLSTARKQAAKYVHSGQLLTGKAISYQTDVRSLHSGNVSEAALEPDGFAQVGVPMV